MPEFMLFVNKILSVLTIAGLIFIVVSTVALLFFLKKIKDNPVFIHISRNGIFFAFIIALTATSGSLFLSEATGTEPCKLCWFERIFMYPQTILFAIALKRKDGGIVYYGIALSAIGAAIAAYDFLLQSGVLYDITCLKTAYSTSCIQNLVADFSNVIPPMMSLTAFVLIIVFMLVRRIYDGRKTE